MPLRTRVPRPAVWLVLFGLVTTEGAIPLRAQDGPLPPPTLNALTFRQLGPFRGGRVTAVDGVPGRPHTFFMGSTGGGVWITENAGTSWRNVTDGWLDVGSIGAVEVAEADPNVIYVGTGSAAIRGNATTGKGVWRSDDRGRTWRFLGMSETGTVARIRTHPRDPDHVFLAATGNPFGRNEKRGVFRSTDGGATWDKVLFHSDSIGAIDLVMDPSNPRILYAALWRGERKPWTMISGAPEGGVYKTTDAGDSWRKLENGLPSGLIGKIGLTVAPTNPDRVWALVEAPDDDAGLYRSEDGGETWALLNPDRRIRSRPWYYNHLHADPTDENTLWALNSGLWKSVDGGRTFQSLRMPHSDHHDLWINPDDPRIMVEGNDGGATVTLDGGRTWSSQLNQPTAEMYSVVVDDQFPYRVYGTQQDNSSLSLPTAATGTGVTLQHWRSHGGCETGPILPRPDDPAVVFSGCFGGRLARTDTRTEEFRQVRPYPQNQEGMAEADLRYRMQWNFALEISPHDPDVLYVGSQFVHRSTDEGHRWEIISPDLTGNDTARFAMAGGPISFDVTGVEIWSALLQIRESPLQQGVLWTGSNDGRVHLSRDGGESWSDVTPPDLPMPATVNRIEPSPHRPERAYLAAYRYRLDDWQPYLYRTDDYGATWIRIADGMNGIPAGHPTRTIREDPEREGLLFAGAEFGLFVSLDDGASWQELEGGLPASPITDLAIQPTFGDLAVATQGRGFWILDDLSLLRQVDAGEVGEGRLHRPRPAYRSRWQDGPGHYARDHVFGAMIPEDAKGTNAPEGAVIYYQLAAGAGSVALEILEADGDVVRRLEGIPSEAGSQRLVWDLRYARPGRDLTSGGGPRAVPGEYRVRLDVDGWSDTQPLTVLKDPRLTAVSVAHLQDQFDFLYEAMARLSALDDAVGRIDDVRDQLTSLEQRLPESFPDAGWVDGAVTESAQLSERLQAARDGLVQELGLFDQPGRVRRQLNWLITAAQTQRGEHIDARPTEGLQERFRDVDQELTLELEVVQAILRDELDALNRLLESNGVGPVVAPRVPGVA
jgi:photosystem II stability/assembly factor-like uncharacterized protein